MHQHHDGRSAIASPEDVCAPDCVDAELVTTHFVPSRPCLACTCLHISSRFVNQAGINGNTRPSSYVGNEPPTETKRFPQYVEACETDQIQVFLTTVQRVQPGSRVTICATPTPARASCWPGVGGHRLLIHHDGDLPSDLVYLPYLYLLHCLCNPDLMRANIAGKVGSDG